MTRKLAAGGGAIAVVLVVGLVVSRAMAPQAGRGPGRPDPARSRSAPIVGVAHPRQVDLPLMLSLTASIESLKQAVILPKTAGYLQQVTVRPGDAVRAGQVVAVVDHAQLDALVAQAQAAVLAAEAGVQTAEAQLSAARAQRLNAVAQLASARAGLQKAQAQLADAQATYARTQALAQEGAVSQQSLDDARTQVQFAQAGVDAAQAQIAQAEAQVEASRQQETAAASQVRTQQAQVATQTAALDNARLGVANATIVAPFGGVVLSRALDPGAYVTPGTSTPILTIADLDHLNVIVHIAESEIPAVHPADPAPIRVDAYPDRVFRGVVSRIAGGVDPITRTVQVEIDVANPEHLLRPGMYAAVELSAGILRALVVPLSALVTVGSQHYVWVVTEGRATQLVVTVGRATGEVVEVTGGLSASELIVVRGTDLVRDGQPVQGAPVSP